MTGIAAQIGVSRVRHSPYWRSDTEMLARHSYPQDDLDACRSRVETQLAATKKASMALNDDTMTTDSTIKYAAS